MERKIGIFDSGIGGLSVLNELFKILPQAEIFYIADDAFAPYGGKDEQIVMDRCHYLTKKLVEKQVDIVVVACNTATAVGIESLRETFNLPFVGIEPYLNILNKDADFVNENFRPVVLTTELMGKSKRFLNLKNRLDPNNKIHLHICKNLATIVEKSFYEGFGPELKQEMVLDLASITDKGFTHAILGCTHYPLLANEIEDILKVKALSPCANVAIQIKNVLEKNSSDQLASFYEVDRCSKEYMFMSTSNGIWKNKTNSSIFR